MKRDRSENFVPRGERDYDVLELENEVHRLKKDHMKKGHLLKSTFEFD